MPTPVMSSVRGESYAEYVIKKSKFIARAVHITTEEEAQAYLRDGKKQYWDARHNCYAYQLGMNFEKQKSSDDGEPSGTAGKPILEVLKNKGLTNTLVVVTRYFGGIKLGTGGLIRAYGTAAVAALDNAIIEDYIDCRILYLQTDYSFLSATERLLPDFEAVITKRDFADFVGLTVEVPEDKADEYLLALRDKTNGTLTVREKDKKIVPHIRPE
ncbi:YigZ family protein [Anaeroglobus sp. AF13-6AC]|uniref:YigZ family protein n=1 Tax=Anaeroglobus sp. AF13-6AC TaxID=2997918 RepID=UPI0022E4D0E1|nr:YigZ family protein [Anaeroglobus sp. AF13-6AC]